MIKNVLQAHFSKSMIADLLFMLSVTCGVVLLVGGLFITVLAVSLPARVSGVDSMVQSVASVMNLVPGIPIDFAEIVADSNITILGIVSWVIGFDLLLVGLGLWARNKIAKWVAVMIFGLATVFDLWQFMLLGVLGSPSSVVGIFANGVFLYLLTKLNF